MRFVARGGKLKVKVKRFFFYFFGGGFNEISSSCVRFECNVLLCGLCVDGMILRSVFFLNDPLYSVRYSVPGRRKVGFQRLQLSNYRDNYETIGRRCAERDPLIGIHCSRSLLEMPMKCVSIRGSLWVGPPCSSVISPFTTTSDCVTRFRTNFPTGVNRGNESFKLLMKCVNGSVKEQRLCSWKMKLMVATVLHKSKKIFVIQFEKYSRQAMAPLFLYQIYLSFQLSSNFLKNSISDPLYVKIITNCV